MTKSVNEALVEYTTESELTAQDDLIQFYPEIAHLTTKQASLLTALAVNIISENTKTDGEIAQDLGIHHKTVAYNRRNPVFARLLAQITVDVVHGMSDKVVANLLRLAEKNVTANKILATIAEIYVSTSKVAMLSARVDARGLQGAVRSPQAAITELCETFGSKGYTLERLLTEISEKWTELHESGVF